MSWNRWIGSRVVILRFAFSTNSFGSQKPRRVSSKTVTVYVRFAQSVQAVYFQSVYPCYCALSRTLHPLEVPYVLRLFRYDVQRNFVGLKCADDFVPFVRVLINDFSIALNFPTTLTARTFPIDPVLSEKPEKR